MSTCPICSKEYEQPKYYERKTCSAKCGSELINRSTRTEVNCLQCEKRFLTRIKKPNKYCSTECFHESRVGVANPGGGNQLPITVYDKICLQCDSDFQTKIAKQKLCCKSCSDEYQKKMKVCPCGQEFHLGNASRKKFCSDECRNKYGQTKKGYEITKVCVGCGEEFTRMSHYTSKMMYCSTKCAKKERKHGWSKAGLAFEDGSVLIFRSLYEMRFVAVCERFGIPWRSYDGPDIQTSLGFYRPDFIIVRNDREYVVEIKGWMDQESATKVEEASAQNPFFLLVGKKDLLEIEQSGF